MRDPTRDTDCDGIADTEDQCPDAAEDPDRFEQTDGCPDPDNDRDGIADFCDACPRDAETVNGKDDDDGCPDFGVGIREHTVVAIRTAILFERASSRYTSDAKVIIETAADVLKEHPEIEGLAVVGNASADEPNGQKLSEERAKAVARALVKLGIDGARIETHGAGAKRPIDAGSHEAARKRNRYADFSIARARGREVTRWDGTAMVPVDPPPPPPPEKPKCVAPEPPPLPKEPCRAPPQVAR